MPLQIIYILNKKQARNPNHPILMKQINASSEIVLVHNHPAINTDMLYLINPEISISPPMEEQVFRSRSFSHNALDIASKIFFLA